MGKKERKKKKKHSQTNTNTLQMCFSTCEWESVDKRHNLPSCEWVLMWIDSRNVQIKYHSILAANSNNCNLSLSSTPTIIHQIGVCTLHSMRFTTNLRLTATTVLFLSSFYCTVLLFLPCFLSLPLVKPWVAPSSQYTALDNERVSCEWFIYEFISPINIAYKCDTVRCKVFIVRMNNVNSKNKRMNRIECHSRSRIPMNFRDLTQKSECKCEL